MPRAWQGLLLELAPQRAHPIKWTNFMLCLLLALCASHVRSAFEDDFVSLPPELASRVPARLVFTESELVQCLADTTAKRCILKGSIDIGKQTWQAGFPSTLGVAVTTLEDGNQTISSELCTARGNCLPGGNHTIHTLNFNRLPYAMLVANGAVLVFSNTQLFNLAPGSAFTYSSSTQYRSTGQGTTTWPSIALEPNATMAIVNSSILYVNPSDTDTCSQYTQKRLFAFRQVWGETNITAVNSTANNIVGPQYINTTIRNGSTDVILGNATVVYRNVTFICMENNTLAATPGGLSDGALAAAIAVPVVVVALAGALLLLCCIRRRRRRQQRQPKQQQQQLALLRKDESSSGHGLRDIESAQPYDGYHNAHHDRERDQVKLNRGQKGDSFSSSKDMLEPDTVAPAALELQPTGTHTGTSGTPDSATRQQLTGSGGLMLPMVPPTAVPAPHRHDSSVAHGSGGVHASGSGGAVQQANSGNMAAGGHGSGGVYGSGGVRGSGGTVGYDAIASGSTFSTAQHLQQFLTGVSQSRSSRSAGMDEKFSSTSALLKARSDVAVLRDLKIGPLLGHGSYGRVYRGRWKATPVAVKIIEHHAAGGRSSGGKTISAGRETLLATSVSHPNVVTTYHISTMSMSERSALATSWLEGSGPSGAQQSLQDLDEAIGPVGGDSDSDASSNSSDLDESPPDMLETWIIMEFCEKGSLERAVRLGKFKRKTEEQAELVGIYKALLDTASGLDYLHSIGVVHGDLKTANVLLKGSTRDARGVTCKITDFGLSRVLDPEATHISTGTYGTIVYMPKELLLSGRMTQATDIYSFGLMMWELFTSQPVMEEGLSIGQMFYMIAYEGWRPQVPEDCPRVFADLMTACWQEDPEQRPDAQQLLRRLQKMYVQAKQQFLAAGGRAGQSARASARAGQRVAAAAAAPRTGPPSADGAAASPFHSAGTPDSVAMVLPRAAAAGAAAAGASGYADTARQQQQQQQQQPQQQAAYGMQRPVLDRNRSSRLASSADETSQGGSIDMSAPAAANARASESGEGDSLETPYQPYVTAVLQRSTSVSSPVLGRPASFSAAGGGTSPRFAAVPVAMGTSPLQPEQLSQLQYQLAQVQHDPAAQQQLLGSYAVFVPPMLPIDVSAGMGMQGGTAGGGVVLQGVDSHTCDQQEVPEQDDWFDEDGMASESLLWQLTNPSNALFGATDLDDTYYSGYLHPAANAAPDQAAAQVQQSMQQTVEQYRQHLQYLQQQAQRQQQ